MKKIFKFLFSRMFVVGSLILFQALIITALIWTLSKYFVYVYAGFTVLSIGIVLWLVNKHDNPSFKLPWVIVIMVVPVFGGLFYLLLGNSKISKKHRKKMDNLSLATKEYAKKIPSCIDEIQDIDKYIASQCKYIENLSGMPVYKNTQIEYLSPGEVKFEKMKQELKNAKHYIFLEYFIIQEGIMWDSILEILKEKASQGLDIRVIYDDVGCLQTLPHKYYKTLQSYGIKCVVFNCFRPALLTVLQNRDHRKICIIDGHTCFTGGINLADEYINAYAKHGYWKDSSIMLKGDAVWSFTLMFLEIWSFYDDKDFDIDKLKPTVHINEKIESDGYVQPYGDTPLDNEYLSESVYLNVINQATDYLYITTPYFIVAYEMLTAITLAAKRGVDVRIITPYIADKWYVHLVTQSHYKQLIKAGVKVYEYTPGFIHSKTFVADDDIAIVGTVNLDYRSLYHHYECGALMYKNSALFDVKNDFLETMSFSMEITKEDCSKTPIFKRCLRALLKIIAPLM